MGDFLNLATCVHSLTELPLPCSDNAVVGTKCHQTNQIRERDINIKAAHFVAFIAITSASALAPTEALAVKNISYSGMDCEAMYKSDDPSFVRYGYGKRNSLTRGMWVRCPAIKYKFDNDGTRTSYVSIYHSKYGSSRCHLISSNSAGTSAYSGGGTAYGTGIVYVHIPEQRAHHDGFYDVWCYLAPERRDQKLSYR